MGANRVRNFCNLDRKIGELRRTLQFWSRTGEPLGATRIGIERQTGPRLGHVQHVASGAGRYQQK
jgi:hypothetical protein